ncbi:IS3 family transposase [Paenibacillus sp. FSL R7-0128]|uniref:IS3 family transposase n=1 Tax=Paenibacillus sp. FSL R7-0128 TaxID=2954529 RepID=UPI0040408C73
MRVICLYLHTYHSFEELKRPVNTYIHFYNYDRLQAKLNAIFSMENRTKTA